PIEVGSGVGCDIVVHDPEVRERHLVVAQTGGAPVLYELASGAPRGPRRIPTGRPIRLGRHYSIVRVPHTPARPLCGTSGTEPVDLPLAEPHPLVLVVGHGGDARGLRLDGGPVCVGSGPDNALVLPDRAVSRRHCRIEGGGGEAFV